MKRIWELGNLVPSFRADFWIEIEIETYRASQVEVHESIDKLAKKNEANIQPYFFPSGHGNEFCNLIGS